MTMAIETKNKLKINRLVNWRSKDSLPLVTLFISPPVVKERETLPELIPETVVYNHSQKSSAMK